MHAFSAFALLLSVMLLTDCSLLEPRASQQALTIDSRIADNAPPRIILGIQVKNTTDYYRMVEEQALAEQQHHQLGSDEL